MVMLLTLALLLIFHGWRGTVQEISLLIQQIPMLVAIQYHLTLVMVAIPLLLKKHLQLKNN